MNTGTPQEGALTDLQSGRFNYIILDFDHTLFLDNSTERFLDALRPRLLAFLVTAVCDWCMQALAWFGLCRYSEQRDYVRVWVCTVLMPWYRFLWPRAAHRHAVCAVNRALLNALPKNVPVVVLSHGFSVCIRPLLDAMALPHAELVCSQVGMRGENLRVIGKTAALSRQVPSCDMGSALFITDSEEDAEVAEACGCAHTVQWRPYAPPAFEGFYVPMRYTVEGKYPRSRYFTYQILLEDFVLLLFAYVFAWPHIFALAGLFLSLYAIYEIGYFENDRNAADLETNPSVSEESHRFHTHPAVKPWLWAACCACMGLIPLYGIGSAGLISGLALWMALLLCLRIVFHGFNSLPPGRRILLFPFLHLFKTFSFVLFIPLTILGILLLTAQVVSMSIHYALYRYGKNSQRFNRQAWRLYVFLALTGGCLLLSSENIFDSPSAVLLFALIVLWNSIRAVECARRKNIVRILLELFRLPLSRAE